MCPTETFQMVRMTHGHKDPLASNETTTSTASVDWRRKEIEKRVGLFICKFPCFQLCCPTLFQWNVPLCTHSPIFTQPGGGRVGNI